MAVIKVGAATETEMKEKKARVEDALNATRAAVEEGIVPGGGVALLRAAKALDHLKLAGDEATGVAHRAAGAGGADPADRGERRARGLGGGREGEGGQGGWRTGFDAESNEYVDMMQAGIIDPTKVERIALQNAASIASLLLTTEALITDIPEREGGHAGHAAWRRLLGLDSGRAGAAPPDRGDPTAPGGRPRGPSRSGVRVGPPRPGACRAVACAPAEPLVS